MTSQHFTTAADGWTEDWGDWGDSSNPSTNRNNNNIVSSSNNPNTLQPLNNPQFYTTPIQNQNPYSLQTTSYNNTSPTPAYETTSASNLAYTAPTSQSHTSTFNQYTPHPVQSQKTDYVTPMAQPIYNPAIGNVVYQEDKRYPLPPPPDNFGLVDSEYLMSQQKNLPDPPTNDVNCQNSQFRMQKPQTFPPVDILDSFSIHQPFEMFSGSSNSSFVEKTESTPETSAYPTFAPQSESGAPPIKNVENTLVNSIANLTLESNQNLSKNSETDEINNTSFQNEAQTIFQAAPPHDHHHSIVNTDRDNYIVTGQLSSQDIAPQNLNYPPPGLSRLVVGQNENNSDQVQYQPQDSSSSMYGINQRMVTGIEDSASYMSFQRQADGEVSQPSLQLMRPPSSSPTPALENNYQREIDGEVANSESQTIGASSSQVSSNEIGSYMNYQRQADGEVSSDPSTRNPVINDHTTVDRSSYFVTGGGGTENQVDSQRFVPGVESDINSQAQSHQINTDLHIFEMNMSVSNILNRDNEVEGIDVTSREEDIDGANDNSETSNTTSNKREKETNNRDGLIVGNDKAENNKKPNLDTSEDEKELQDLDYPNSKTRAKRRPRRNESYDSDSHRTREKPIRGDDYERRERHGHGSDSRKKNEDSDDHYRKREKKRSSRNKKYSDNDEYESERGTRRYREKDREKTRRSKDLYDDERRQRTGRRSHGDRERDRERAPYGYYANYPGFDQYGGGYNPYAQLEHLRRTNPQAYYEWYTKYYAGMMHQQSAMQHQHDGMSLHSGYSSSNEKDKSSSARFQTGGPISHPLQSNNSMMMSSSMVDGSEYNSLSGFPMRNESFNYIQNYNFENREKLYPESQRLTPKKFECLHNFIGLSHGLLSTKDTTVTIQNIQFSDKARRVYQTYPGPLVRESSHKKTVIEFCEEKLNLRSLHKPFEASYSLIWSFLILMIRQNGNYTEGDVSELLMKNAVEFKSALDTKRESCSEDGKQSPEGVEGSENEFNDGTNEHSTATTQSFVSEELIIHKFREFLLYGNIGDALEFATDNNLWGHALFLASKVDKRQHANVMLKFANKLPYNDPLQTLYQIMSGRTPACVTNLDEKWGDWRPHLAMIISNCKDKPELVKKSIISLGDLLCSRGDYFGSHFCYLIAEPAFAEYTSSNPKIVLIGASPKQSFTDFATDEAIMMTEIFEYARSLSDSNFNISSLANYKFLLASRMLDYGFQLKALLYMEEIAKQIIKHPNCFEKDFISKIYSLADRLKFYDPVIAKSYEDNYNNNEWETAENQKWLQDLWQILNSDIFNQNVTYQNQQVPLYEQNQQVQNDYTTSVDGYDYNQSATNQYQQMTPVHVPTIPSSYQDNYESEPPPMQIESQPIENYTQEQTYQQTYSADVNQNQSDIINQSNLNSQYNNYYDYSTQYQSQQPTITLGNTVANKFNDENDSSSPKKEKMTATTQPKQSPEKTKKVALDDAHQSSGWFGGIFSKLSIKPKNQMILPDDKNPTILWDENTKKWINKDETAAESEAFKPPPKMDFPQMQPMPQQQAELPNSLPALTPQQNHMPQMNPATNNDFSNSHVSEEQTQMSKVEPPSQNMFKMQKGRNIKKSYVNLLSNSGQTVAAKEIAPDIQQTLFTPISQQQPQTMQFYNPNDFH